MRGEVSVETFVVRGIGVVRSTLRDLEQAPRQPDEGAPEAELVFDEQVSNTTADSQSRRRGW